MALGSSSRCFYEGTPLAHPSVSLGKPMSATQPISVTYCPPVSFSSTSLWQCFRPAPPPLPATMPAIAEEAQLPCPLVGMWGGYPGSVGPTISRPGKRHQRVISWCMGGSCAHHPTLLRLRKSLLSQHCWRHSRSPNPPPLSSEPTFLFSLEDRGSPSKGLLQLQSSFVLQFHNFFPTKMSSYWVPGVASSQSLAPCPAQQLAPMD